MPVATQFREERAELEAVLNSGTFARSPSLAQFLQYICQMYFEGRAGEIKEYNVAVEAFGRHPDFDQKKDSIVRVEAHRLRKRLLEYYSKEGADHEIHIAIPPGNYSPSFRHKDGTSLNGGNGDLAHVGGELLDAEEVASLELLPVEEIAISKSATAPFWKRSWVWAAGGAVLLVLLAGWFLFDRVQPKQSPTPADAFRVPAAAADEVRILAGSSAEHYIDDQGNVWGGDRYFDGGEAVQSSVRQILRTRDPNLYLARRQGNFRYDIPLKPGSHELRLYFAETIFGENNDAGGGESSRVFEVRANGAALASPIDIVSDAGGSNTAEIKVFKDVTPAADGKLHLEFRALLKEAPFINAIEILPSARGYMRPVRLVMREKGFTDSSGVEWMGDYYGQGGQTVSRRDAVSGPKEPELFRHERYGNFTYTIPVARDGRYAVTLRFSEHWFGPGRTGGGGKGTRVFNVLCNGSVLVKNFDVFAESGNNANTKTFRFVEPNAQGKIVLHFQPVKNYAMVNAIEVVDEGVSQQ